MKIFVLRTYDGIQAIVGLTREQVMREYVRVSLPSIEALSFTASKGEKARALVEDGKIEEAYELVKSHSDWIEEYDISEEPFILWDPDYE